MKCPLPRYYLCHVVFALLIAVVVWPVLGLDVGLAAGTGFYAGREFTQWEQGGGAGVPFDWKGVLAPAIACSIVLAIYYGVTP